ncbi:Cytochrome b6-f complex subunit 7, chloroplastic [Tetrabaena socialis]|uniref:Cytochrome b6-f complex subunit 7, chloroplastic n=1 Tax=Tetrabaena socialis TaxID=47790 RepID=A0A2J7ZP37_9CHLO|nr:Cytochrome b6-f complex subunit 7, chloroplastic [Tetrabaena socialis]|eukprot:PNH02031.1 Cytochrome b6-f complex subunit 7, chloroplastic [Tetrabaena socialis]
MAFSLARSACVGVSPRTSSTRVAAARPAARPSLRTVGQKAPAPSRGVATHAVNELAMIAGEASFITGTALTMVGMTLLGLAIGFVLLRVESLVESGKI